MISPLFISHGSPTIAIEENEYTQKLAEIGSGITPKAIVIFTAHWEKEVTTISYRDDTYQTIHDFGGFSEELHNVTYSAKGSTEVASEVEKLLSETGIATMQDKTRGLDHGSWVILKHMYPKADIPVVQLSVNPYLEPKEQYKIGSALKKLSGQDVLVIGSGGISHNLGMVKWGQKHPEKWTTEFDDWVIEHVEERKLEELFQYAKRAPNANLAVPRAEHFVPLFIALGSGSDRKQPKTLHRSYDFGTLSYIIFEF